MAEKDNNYLSLANAAKLCPYSQEYLSLRARQGKLKAIKLGRNWVIKKEWLDEYLKKMQQYHELEEPRKPEKPKKEVVGEEKADNKFAFLSPEIRFGFVLALAFAVLLLPFLFFEKQGPFCLFSYAGQSIELSAAGIHRLGSAFLENCMQGSVYVSPLWSSSLDFFGDYFVWLGEEISLKAEMFPLIFK